MSNINAESADSPADMPNHLPELLLYYVCAPRYGETTFWDRFAIKMISSLTPVIADGVTLLQIALPGSVILANRSSNIGLYVATPSR